MRICVLGLRGLPHVMGGVETHCEQLFPLMKELHPGDTFTIIARKAYLREQVSEYHGLQIVSLPHVRSKYFETITNTLCGLVYARVALNADLLHLHGIGPALVAPIAKALGMKVIVTYHSKNYEHHKWNRVAKFILRIGELCAVIFSDRVIAVSQCLAKDLRRRFPWAESKVVFIPNGASHIDAVRSETRCDDAVLTRHGLERKKYILGVGRLVPEKGFYDLCHAFKQADLNCKLVIAGEADHRDGYSERLRRLANEKLVFTGCVARHVVRDLLANASLFVLSSHNEGFPIAALEAIGAGTPTLLSDIEANRDLGLAPRNYFNVGDVDDLRRKISQDHELYRVCAADRDRVLHEYDWHVICEKTDRLYSTLQRPATSVR
jgi:glycosyltransferase involved in cell wall biosynthesis